MFRSQSKLGIITKVVTGLFLNLVLQEFQRMSWIIGKSPTRLESNSNWVYWAYQLGFKKSERSVKLRKEKPSSTLPLGAQRSVLWDDKGSLFLFLKSTQMAEKTASIWQKKSVTFSFFLSYFSALSGRSSASILLHLQKMLMSALPRSTRLLMWSAKGTRV